MKFPDIQTASFEMTLDDLDLFEYLDAQKVVVLKNSAVQQLVKG